MSQLDQILAVLQGEKRFDGAKWVAYDAGAAPLTDAGGVLWRGLHGWLLYTEALSQAGAKDVGAATPRRATSPLFLPSEQVEPKTARKPAPEDQSAKTSYGSEEWGGIEALVGKQIAPPTFADREAEVAAKVRLKKPKGADLSEDDLIMLLMMMDEL